jgi:hypothetical protein
VTDAAPGEVRLWRVFPWDSKARAGEPFSPSYQPTGQGTGRFDLPGRPSGVLYTAETPEHAIGERIQFYRGQVLDAPDLVVAGRPLAISSVMLPSGVRHDIADLCDPRVLVRLRTGPDDVAARARRTTQQIAHAVFAGGQSGLRWWSAFFGEWHTVVLFRERLPVPLAWSSPEALSIGDDRLLDAARLLGIVTARSR